MIALDSLDRIAGVRHGFFDRCGGVSDGLYASKNCGYGSRDARENVTSNRARCLSALHPRQATLVTVRQVHGIQAATATEPWAVGEAPQADALVTDRPNLALGILTADCAPVLFCDPKAGVIGAAHAGWKGVLAGVVEATLAAMAALGAAADRTLAAIGPHIGPSSYEVGPEFIDRFTDADADNAQFFDRGRDDGRALFDLGGYVSARLSALGLAGVARSTADTCMDESRFFSYRRATRRGEPDYGRCLSAIVIDG